MILKEGPYRGSMMYEIPSIFHCWAIKNIDKLDPELSKGYIDWLRAREGRIKVSEKRFTRQLLTIRFREYDEHFLNQPKAPKGSGSFVNNLFTRSEGGENAKSGV